MATISDPADPMDVSTDIKSQHMRIVDLEPLDIMFIRRIMNHTYVHVNQFGNSAYLISTLLLPEARLTGCEIAKPDADLTEPTALFLRKFLARVRPPVHFSPTAPVDPLQPMLPVHSPPSLPVILPPKISMLPRRKQRTRMT